MQGKKVLKEEVTNQLNYTRHRNLQVCVSASVCEGQELCGRGRGKKKEAGHGKEEHE